MSPDLKSEIQQSLNQIAERCSYGGSNSFGEVRRLVSYYLSSRVRAKYNFDSFDIKTNNDYSRGIATFTISMVKNKPTVDYNEFVFEVYN